MREAILRVVLATTIATWNTAWRSWLTPAGKTAVDLVQYWGADVLVLTEVDMRLTQHVNGETVDAGGDWGYNSPAQRRKVLLWSKTPWRDVVTASDVPGLRSGRYVSGTTRTPIGELRVVGVCVPWRMDHVTGGRRDSAPWETHRQHLTAMVDQLAVERAYGLPVVVAGDFNQRFHGRYRAPVPCRDVLARALEGFTVTTGTINGPRGVPLIDHVAIAGLTATETAAVAVQHDGRHVSDHDAVVVTVASSTEANGLTR
jgi:endonuclease/exonuclease/phosphatase (EEP) superfamily protein YafD